MTINTKPTHRRSQWTFRRSLVLLVLTALPVIYGCSGDDGGYDGPVGSVQGKVTVSGKALPEGTTIQFSSDKGYSNAAKLDSEGSFEIEDLPTGTYQIYLTAPTPEPSDDANAPAPKEGPPPFPKKYLQADTSGEKFDVKEGDNDYSLKIE